MTLAFALRGINGIILGADSRMSGPSGSTDTGTKFLQVNREIGVLTYGLSEVGYKAIVKLVDEVNRTSDFTGQTIKRIVHFTEIANISTNIFKQTFDEWYIKFTESERGKQLQRNHPLLTTGFILGGFDLNETNQFKIYAWRSPDFDLEDRPDIIAAQWPISQYLVNQLYYPEMSVEQLKKLGVFLLAETETISTSVGGPFQIATITVENGFQRINDREVQDIINENQYRFAEFRKTLLNKLG